MVNLRSPIKIDGKFKIVSNKGNNYLLAIEIDDKNEKLFEKLERTLLSLASTILPAKQENFKLIKRSKNTATFTVKFTPMEMVAQGVIIQN